MHAGCYLKAICQVTMVSKSCWWHIHLPGGRSSQCESLCTHNTLLSLSGASPHLRDFSNTWYSQHGLSLFLLSTWIPLWGTIHPANILLSPPQGCCSLPGERESSGSWSWISYGMCHPFLRYNSWAVLARVMPISSLLSYFIDTYLISVHSEMFLLLRLSLSLWWTTSSC